MFFTTALAVLLGMVCRFYFPQFSRRISKPIFYFGFACLFYPMISVFRNFGGLIDPSNIIQSTSAILLNVTMMCFGAGLGTLFGLSRSQSRTLSVEVGIQNFALVMVVILIFLKDLTLITPAVFYLPSMYLSAFALSYLSRKHNDEMSGVKPESWKLFYWSRLQILLSSIWLSNPGVIACCFKSAEGYQETQSSWETPLHRLPIFLPTLNHAEYLE